jgi:uncharacterized protein VirK/YbjX
LFIEDFDITSAYTDKIDLRQFGANLNTNSLSLTLIQSYDTHSDDSGSSTASFYDNHHNVVSASFSVTNGEQANLYIISLGVTSDQVLQNSWLTNSIFVV